MMISTRGRYALRVMIDLAERGGEGLVSMKSMAQRQQISLKYLEQIVPVLVRNSLIEGMQGRCGGYRLCRKPEDYPIGEIVRLTDDSPVVACLAPGADACPRATQCRTLPLWTGLQRVVDAYLDGITLADLMQPAGDEPACHRAGK